MADDKKIATDVLEAVGGKENVSNLTHCFTRLRFNLKDRSIAVDEEVKGIDGVLGVQERGGQYQVIIGPSVPQVYEEIVAQGVHAGGEVNENLDAVPAEGEKKPLTPKQVGANILDYISGTVVPLIPIFIAGALFKTLGSILGPTFLNLVPADGAFVTFSNNIYNASSYFLPIMAGFAAAKRLGVNPFLGALMGAIMIEPNFTALAGAGVTSYEVYGIAMPTGSYGGTLIPALLSVWVMSYVSRFFDKHVHESLRTVFAPFLTVAVMIPLNYGIFGPLGSWMGTALAGGLAALAATPLYPVVVGFLGATWVLLVLSGMHLGIAAISLAQFAETGADNLVLLAANITNFISTFVGLAAWVRIRNKEEKNLALGYVITQCFGGVGEPLLFGVFMKYPCTWLGVFAGGFVSAFLGAVLGVICYAPAQGFFSFLDFVGGSPMNFPFAVLSIVAGCVVAFVVTYLFGFTKEELTAMSEE